MTTTIRMISEILDRHIEATPGHLDLIRVSKVQEEAGEAMAAMIAYQNVNPRKPAGPLGTVIEELADVALTALCAIEHFDYDSGEVLSSRELAVYWRLTGDR